MELRQLRYFVAVAEELSFTRASKRLHVSQPPISRQIARLEEEIGTLLLERTKQRVTLTEAGRAFHEQAVATLASAETAITAARRASEGQVGTLALGFGGSVAHLLPAVLSRFRASHPAVELQLHPLILSQHYEALVAGTIDFVLLIPPVQSDRLQLEPFASERLVAALPPGHPLAGRARLRLTDLADCDFVLYPWSRGHGFGRLIMRTCSRAGFVPRVVQEAAPTESIIGLVGAGLGVAVVPAMAQRLRIARVVFKPLAERYAAAEIAMAWRKDNRSPALRRFIETARLVRPARASRAQAAPP